MDQGKLQMLDQKKKDYSMSSEADSEYESGNETKNKQKDTPRGRQTRKGTNNNPTPRTKQIMTKSPRQSSITNQARKLSGKKTNRRI